MARRRESRPSHYSRSARLGELLREILASELARLDDDRLELASVTGVETSVELSQATVYISALDDEVATVAGRRSSEMRPLPSLSEAGRTARAGRTHVVDWHQVWIPRRRVPGRSYPASLSLARTPKRARSDSRPRRTHCRMEVTARWRNVRSECASSRAERRRSMTRSLLDSSGSLAPSGTRTSILPHEEEKERMVRRGWTKAPDSVHGPMHARVAVVTRHPAASECATATIAAGPRRRAWRVRVRHALTSSAPAAIDALQGYQGKASAPSIAPACTAASTAATTSDGRSSIRSVPPGDSGILVP